MEYLSRTFISFEVLRELEGESLGMQVISFFGYNKWKIYFIFPPIWYRVYRTLSPYILDSFRTFKVSRADRGLKGEYSVLVMNWPKAQRNEGWWCIQKSRDKVYLRGDLYRVLLRSVIGPERPSTGRGRHRSGADRSPIGLCKGGGLSIAQSLYKKL